MADRDKAMPDWVPDWFPQGKSLEYCKNVIQVGILLLAASYLLRHLLKGKVSKVTATAAGAS